MKAVFKNRTETSTITLYIFVRVSGGMARTATFHPENDIVLVTSAVKLGR